MLGVYIYIYVYLFSPLPLDAPPSFLCDGGHGVAQHPGRLDPATPLGAWENAGSNAPCNPCAMHACVEIKIEPFTM